MQSLPWILHDASQDGVGAVLSQQNDRSVILYASRVLTKPERQYCTTRREMLALIWAVQHFKPYLWGRPFVVRTDHIALLRNGRLHILQTELSSHPFQQVAIDILGPLPQSVRGSKYMLVIMWTGAFAIYTKHGSSTKAYNLPKTLFQVSQKLKIITIATKYESIPYF